MTQCKCILLWSRARSSLDAGIFCVNNKKFDFYAEFRRIGLDMLWFCVRMWCEEWLFRIDIRSYFLSTKRMSTNSKPLPSITMKVLNNHRWAFRIELEALKCIIYIQSIGRNEVVTDFELLTVKSFIFNLPFNALFHSLLTDTSGFVISI